MDNLSEKINRYKEEMTTLVRDKNKDSSYLQAYTEQLEEDSFCIDYGFVKITLTDEQSGCAIDNARVMITFLSDENREELSSFTFTDKDGETTKIKLRARWNYTVNVSAEGYKTKIENCLCLEKDEFKQINFTLEKNDLNYDDASVVILAGQSAINRHRQKECCVFPMRIGDEGECVLNLQKEILNLSRVFDFIPPRLTGKFGQKTASAVGRIQRIFSLEVTYCVDEITYDAILSANDALNEKNSFDEDAKMFISFPKNKILSLGDKNEEVLFLQLALVKLSKRFVNITPICLTGVFDEATQTNVFTLQTILGLPSTGRVGHSTMSAILKIS